MGFEKLKTDVKYLQKDFKGYKDRLNNFAQTYFPTIHNDFNEASPAQMFVELSAYVGDVLSFYIDTQLRESLLLHARERSNVLDIAKGLGYKSPAAVAASATLDIYILLPANGSGATTGPDWRYAPEVQSGLETAAGTTNFFSQKPVDFRVSSSADPTDISVYKIDANGNPETFLIKKQVTCKSGNVKYKKYSFSNPKKYDSILLQQKNIIEIIEARDSDQNKWYEVDYLAQNLVYEEVQNTSYIDPEFAVHAEDTPYLLKLRKTGRRFTQELLANGKTKVNFGAGNSTVSDELIVPNPNNIGMQLPYGNTSAMDNAWDPSNTMFTRAYGTAPSDTVITFKYLVGGGIKSNVRAGEIREVQASSFSLNVDGLARSTVDFVYKSLAVNNPSPATGGKSQETVEEIRQNAMAFYAAQNRAVTREDFLSRVYSMPGRFGNIAKAYIIQDEQFSKVSGGPVQNPLALNLYVLAYNNLGQLTKANQVTKENLRNYLKRYRMLTDAVNIKDGHIVNLGIDYSIIPLPSYNSKSVLLQINRRLASMFNILNWQFNEPIFAANIATEIDKIEGVQTVQDINIYCKWDTDSGYSGNYYDIIDATKNKIVYPSQDPIMWEVKYPTEDIRGKVVTY